MLTRLELIGFKSFADRTRFDFAPGITAVVGPNGSGKSNVVDAVRWLLGEQSAKSLRGGEMTDVIFNGSSTRKSLGMAEVTMTFDNTRRELAFDTDEVQLTRRVYRDGQGEYLINGQDARLKDIKELFLGTGAGHGAYSVIEQGRVDALLSATTKDRRQIFEEAAGISRFKAKKTETLRKLASVEDKLTRVRDILAELDKQLRTLRLQTAKAQKYQQYTARLKDLRVGASLAEFRSLSVSLEAEEAVLASLRTELADVTARAETEEETLRKLDWDLGRTEDSLRHQEAKLADARQQIATHDAAARSERSQTANLEAELLRIGKQRVDLGHRTRTVETEAERVGTEVEFVGKRAEAEQQRAATTAAVVAEVTTRIAELAQQAAADRNLQMDLLNRSGKLHTDAEVTRVQADRLRQELARKRSDSERLSARHDTLDKLLADLSQTDADLRQRLDEARRDLAEHRGAQTALREQAETLQPDLDALREKRSSLHGRLDVLEGLERSLEGFGAGVRAVVHRVQRGELPVLGLVADLLTAPRDVAPLIDLALGDAAQRFVVQDEAALDAILANVGELLGRVGFVPVAGRERERPEFARSALAPVAHAPGSPSASSLVRCDLPGLADQLLGHVLIVPDLATARAQSQPGYRIITRAGELLEPDGTVTVGPQQAETGIVSRKSELRELQAQIADLDDRIAALEDEQADLRAQADGHAAPIRAREAEIAALTGEAGSLRDQILEQRQVQRQLADTLELLARESAITESELQRANEAWQLTKAQGDELDRQAEAVRLRIAEADRAIANGERERDEKVRENTDAQVALSRVNERLAGLRKKKDELDAELRQRRIDAVNLSSADRAARLRHTESVLATLRATSASAIAYADKDAREHQVADLTARRDALRSQREQLQEGLKQFRDAWQDRRDQAHARELVARDLLNRRDAVAQRVQDEYGVALAQMTDEPILLTRTDDPPAEQEIADLRQKIAKLGSVNLEALDELADVEKRETDLRTQFADLTDGQTKLVQIIEQINTDSRVLFAETMAAVRGHFQELFRKLFGGGMADVVLEDETDILESGIEITARPPGKELQRISLLSGGERALTAVALLLAIFRSKPSPFCLLDEVDAAMDEANTQRLAGLLREFSERSQFIVITHKKRTMAIADVLHGVTMQESGVSKLVGVRFEDWPDEEAELIRQAA